MFSLSLCVMCMSKEQYVPFGALQVGPVAQKDRKEAVELIHIRPDNTVQSGNHTLQ